MRRHNQLCRTWTMLLCRAGWHVQRQQSVPLAGGDTKKVDLVVVSFAGLTTVCDLQVTAAADHSLAAGPTLQAAAQNKARLYHTTPNGSLPDGRKFTALIHSADSPWMHERTLRFFHAVCRQSALAACPADYPHWGSHFASHRNLAAAELGHCLALSTCQMHSACGTLLA